MKNLLLEKVEYKVEETNRGSWRRYMYPTGELFEEFVSYSQVMGLPLLHYTKGRCPETGKRLTAVGFIAIGRKAIGVVAIGQASMGVIAIGQLAVGLAFGFGQATTGVIAIGQLALGLAFGLGQFVTGYLAIGQFGLGRWVLAQVGLGMDVWDTRGATDAAKAFFKRYLGL